jgi:hypothetical protein
MKPCNVCEQTLPTTSFYKHSKTADGLATRCKECTRVGNLAARHRRSMHYAETARSRRRERLDKYAQWKSQQRCQFCPETSPCCLDLHHLDPSQKDQALANVASRWSWERLSREIEKCIVVCRNCHAKIHAGIIVLEDSMHGA